MRQNCLQTVYSTAFHRADIIDFDVQAGEVLPTSHLRHLTLWVVPTWNTSNEQHHISLSGPSTSWVLHWPPSYLP